MNSTKHLVALTTAVLVSISSPVMAHSGDHSQGVLIWFRHMLTSGDHLLALSGLALLLAVGYAGWNRPRNKLVSKRGSDFRANVELADR